MSYAIQRLVQTGIYFVRRNNSFCEKLKQDKLRLKNDLKITRHNNQVYKAKLDNMKLESSVSAEIYNKNITDLRNEIERLKSKENNKTEMFDLISEKNQLTAKNDNLEHLIKKQTGMVQF